MPKTKTFSVFRYQLLPLSTKVQIRTDDKYSSYSDLINKKNDFFKEVLIDGKTNYRGKGYEVICKVEHVDEVYILLRMGVEKAVDLHDKNFNTKREYDYPNLFVYVNNEKTKQYILIEQQSNAFFKTDVLKNIIEKAVTKGLNGFHLAIYIEKVKDASKFWETMRRYEGRIKALKFDFIRPNMANISGAAKQAIKMLNNECNSHKTTLQLNAPAGGVLENIDEGNKEISALAEYQAEGGGESHVKITGLRRFIKTNDKEQVIEVSEAAFDNMAPNQIVGILNALLNNIEK